MAKRLKYQADKTFVDEAWKMSVTSETRRESKEQKQIGELQQQICAVSANDAEARLHCQQLVILHTHSNGINRKTQQFKLACKIGIYDVRPLPGGVGGPKFNHF